MRQLSLTKYALMSLVQAYATYIVGTRLDYYCNTILAGTTDSVIKRLQSVQKTAARLVSGTIFRDYYHYFRSPTGF